MPGGKAGRVVDDFVSLPDLAPTFLEVGGVAPPAGMSARSLLAVLRDARSGQIDPERTWVVTGRERHVDDAREGNLPYPMRALRTREFLYIRNFAPDRWPLGAPGRALDPALLADGTVAGDTRIGLADMDAGPTKAWLIAHREEPIGEKFFDLSFAGRRRSSTICAAIPIR